ncbi:class I SAM-dependent methyltransferase [Caballeronia sp. LZ062]|uniref:class I SAM-dependent methyltransferase n=1 Tax=unclassified Caballeronia TaxID=2646786 RepID=UPI00285B04D8|nr:MULTISPECIES: class I SAM-dependent methyltransferase [unclassified Caballeronia]MDR5855254.1 class I SAM-dependent methyltransferase [Caballeronia sp. LZ050]MDR5870217.1 class I SAM-dependent methyltransferase [Caballeronia sp. LZ062]
MANRKLEEYIRTRSREVAGWLPRCDGEIFKEVLEAQVDRGIDGSIVEIGIHHGRSFIPLALSNEGRRCYAIDIFARQDLNRDSSGRGDKEAFLANLKSFGLAADAICIDERLSTLVKPDDILEKVGLARFFHIDGGHDVETVVNDLMLAQAVLRDDGVIAIDDIFRHAWPEVSMGVFSYLANQQSEFVPFAYGHNKAYMCRRPFGAMYRELLMQSEFLEMFYAKSYAVSRDEVLVFQRYVSSDSTIRRRLVDYLMIYHADFAFHLRKRFRRAKRMLHVQT